MRTSKEQDTTHCVACQVNHLGDANSLQLLLNKFSSIGSVKSHKMLMVFYQ